MGLVVEHPLHRIASVANIPNTSLDLRDVFIPFSLRLGFEPADDSLLIGTVIGY
jgi:hypothetical protein